LILPLEAREMKGKALLRFTGFISSRIWNFIPTWITIHTYTNLFIVLLFTNEMKMKPAWDIYLKDSNLHDFRDRMRGYLGFPRRRSSLNRSSKSQRVNDNFSLYYRYHILKTSESKPLKL
jgi:hypothetical protein